MASEGGAVPPDRAVAHRRTRPATFYLGGMGRTWVLLTDGASTAEAVEVLRGLRSPVDFNVYVWREQPGRWRLLTLQEKRLLWDLRHA